MGNGIGEAPPVTDLTPMTGCSGAAWTVRFAISLGPVEGGTYQPLMKDGRHVEKLLEETWNAGRDQLYEMFDLAPADEPPNFKLSMYHTVKVVGPYYHLIVNSFFPTKERAQAAADKIELDGVDIFGMTVDEEAEQSWAGYVLSRPRVYTWRVQTTSAGWLFDPTGMEVDFVSFDAGGCSAGCWRIDVTYTLGQDNWNIFYIPRTDIAGGPPVDTLSYDYEYGQDVLDTYLPANFPCRSFDYEPDNQNPMPIEITACCLPEFYRKYRVLGDPDTDPAGGESGPPYPYMCDPISEVPQYVQYADRVDLAKDRYLMPNSYVSGDFDFDGIAGGMGRMVDTQLLDPFVNQWRATLMIDEKELRNKAGILQGTVGVSHTIDTFIGLAEFKPTGQQVLDSFTKQTNIHLEKTDIMTASTHGENDYTFLRYINLRLIEVLNEDVTYSDDETASAFSRTLRFEAAHYLQVSFTMGPQYRPKAEMDLIPLDSIRVGYGPFITETRGRGELHHACMQYASPASSNLNFKDQAYKDLFHRRFPHCVSDLEEMTPAGDVPNFASACPENTFPVQNCAPDARMCANPQDTPDQFVVFNIPLGIDYLPAGSMFLDQKVHVSLVVQAENLEGDAPDSAEITKTTLTASVPVIPGGQNIFCDGIIGRSDLNDIARAVVLVGSAQDESELSQIQIFGEGDDKIANTKLNPAEPQRVSAASIESGLMTLVIMGNETFFDNPAQRNSYRAGLELEDLITVHIMESDRRFDGPNTLSQKVLTLLKEEGESNYNENNELNLDGYRLNGAFHMTINRAEQRAELNPTTSCTGPVTNDGTGRVCGGKIGLLWYCGWRLQASSQDEIFKSGCILRRDWAGRGPNTEYPYGSDYQSAMELPFGAQNLPTTPDWDDFKTQYASMYDDWREETGTFMTGVLNAGDYSYDLGQSFAKVIEDRYRLDGRSRRAWWINPSYTWTASQTGGEDRFSLTQKIIMFALFNMNEKFAYRTASGLQERRHQRRFLMQFGQPAPDTQVTGDGLSMVATSIIYETSPAQMLADAYGVPRRQVGSWLVGVQLKADEACKTEEELITWGRQRLAPIFEQTASEFWTLQVSEARVDRADVNCRRRAENDFSNAKVEFGTIVVFKGSRPTLDQEAFVKNVGIYKLEEVGEQVVNRNDALIAPDIAPEKKSKSQAGMIGALVGVFVGVVLIGLGGWWWWTKRDREAEDVQAIETAAAGGLNDVKVELEADMARAGVDLDGLGKGGLKSEFGDLLGESKPSYDDFEPEGKTSNYRETQSREIDF